MLWGNDKKTLSEKNHYQLLTYLHNNIRILAITQEPIPEQNDTKKNQPENTHKF